MAYLRNHRTPATAPGGLEWADSEAVVEVPDHLVTDLLRIQGAGFSEVLPGDPAHPEYAGPEPAADAEDDGDADDAGPTVADEADLEVVEESALTTEADAAAEPAADTKRTRTRTPRAEQTQIPE